MGPKFLRCPGCNVTLQFKPNTLATMVTCPKCGEQIPVSIQDQTEQIIEVEAELVSDAEIVDSDPSAAVPLSDRSNPGRTALLILSLILVSIGMIVGGASLVYVAIASAERQLTQTEPRRVPAPPTAIEDT